MASVDEKQKESNFWCLKKLIMEAQKVLRAKFDSIIKPADLAMTLIRVKGTLDKLKRDGIINKKQYEMLNPNPDSGKFDATLLACLLQNICNLNPKDKVWNETDNANIKGHTDQENIQRIKNLRNKMDHKNIDSLEQQDFESSWNELKQAMIDLGTSCGLHDIEDTINNIRTEMRNLQGLQIQVLPPRNRDINDYTKHVAKLETLSDVVAVFPAYRCEDATKMTVIVVAVKQKKVSRECTEELEEMKRTKHIDYVIIDTSSFKTYADTMESRQIRVHDTEREMLDNCIKKNAEHLMSKHKYLSIIQGNLYKTSNIKKGDEPVYEPRLVLYVLAKGFIPIEEYPFDTVYDGIQVDVHEGIFTLFGNHADDALDNIRMGCRIERVVDGQCNTGTLGVFFEHPTYGLCGITCAHAILTKEEHRNCIEYGLKKTYVDVVFQPASPHVLGHVVEFICSKGTMSNKGNDLAIIRIDDRKPVNGKWPQPKSDDKDLEFEYTSGRVFTSKTYAGNCYKFGVTTEYTEGRIANFGLNETREILMHDTSVPYNNLIEVEQLRNRNKFANNGDSGAPVFVKDGDGDYVCIGILIGGVPNVGPYYVIPIEKILNDIGITKLKSFSPSNAELAKYIGQLQTTVEIMNQKIDIEVANSISLHQKMDLILARLPP